MRHNGVVINWQTGSAEHYLGSVSFWWQIIAASMAAKTQTDDKELRLLSRSSWVLICSLKTSDKRTQSQEFYSQRFERANQTKHRERHLFDILVWDSKPVKHLHNWGFWLIFPCPCCSPLCGKISTIFSDSTLRSETQFVFLSQNAVHCSFGFCQIVSP